jgi:AAA family ATP:ADP antiporter
MAVTAGLAFVLGRQVEGRSDGRAEARWSLREVRQLLQREPYVTRLAGLVLVSSVAVTLADFVFKSEVTLHVAPDDLGRFFATFYAGLSVLALFVQVVLMGWILRALDVHRALWALPLLMLGGASGVVVGGGLVAAILLKGADGALRPSLNRTSTELLFLPIPDRLRSRVKPAIDVIGQRGGQAVASVFILSQLALGRGDVVLAVFVAVLCVAWIAAIAELRPHYVEMFRRALREGLIEARGGLPELDLVSLETLFASLNSRDDAEVIAALDLLHAEDRTHLVPALILYHPTPAVVLRALELFEASGRTDFVPVADRLVVHADPEVRAAALRARSALEPDEDRVREALGDASPLVRATALAGLLAEAHEADLRPLQEVILSEKSPEVRRALARAIQRRPVPAFVPVLEALATEPDDDVQVAVARSIGALRQESFRPTLLEQLRREAVRPEARRAFREFGPAGLEFLEAALADTTLPQELRRHIPRAIASFPAPEAVEVLQRHLLLEQDGMVRFRILRALGRVATRHPGVPLDDALLAAAAGRTLGARCRLGHWRDVLEQGAADDPRRATPGHQMLVALLRDKADNAEERLFRLLDLLYRREDFRRIYRGLRSADRRVEASSRELLENVVRPPLKAAVLALVDDVPTPARREATAAFYEPEPLDYESVITKFIELPGETLRSLAVFHVGELGLQGMQGRIEELRSQETSLFVGQIFDRTLRLLGEAGEGAGAS